jgi:hypothetical protein
MYIKDPTLLVISVSARVSIVTTTPCWSSAGVYSLERALFYYSILLGQAVLRPAGQ